MPNRDCAVIWFGIFCILSEHSVSSFAFAVQNLRADRYLLLCDFVVELRLPKISREMKENYMNQICVEPRSLNGTVSMPPSKSAAHRAIICAALAKGKSVLRPVTLSNDILATIRCMKALGAEISLEGDKLTVDGTNTFSCQNVTLDCGESGSTLRFLIPLAAAGGVSAVFTGHGKLPERPIGVLTDCLPQHGTQCLTEGGLPLRIDGALKSGTFSVAGHISSQFITGLLLSLPLLKGDSEIVLTSPAQSVGYIDMTIDVMKDFGVNVTATPDGWHIAGNQHYQPRTYTIEGDWSQAAFFMTAAALGGRITIDNLNPDSKQGDKACMEIYARFGAKISVNEQGHITIEHDQLKGIPIYAADIPDMVPALAVTAAFCEGTTVITGAERLRIKECDRLAAMRDGLSRLGADIRETEDGLIINGVRKLRGGFAEGYNDHRIVMSLAVASVGASGNITLSDMESINKSYPDFFNDIQKLGGKAYVIMG